MTVVEAGGEVFDYYDPRGFSARAYDVLQDTAGHEKTGDADFYAGLAPAGGRVLDVGAGTGRLCIDLARRGFLTGGLEPAASMLDQARRKVAGLPPDVAERITLWQGDVRSWDPPDRFDLVLFSFFCLHHLPTHADVAVALRMAHGALVPGGKVAVHCMGSDVSRWAVREELGVVRINIPQQGIVFETRCWYRGVKPGEGEGDPGKMVFDFVFSVFDKSEQVLERTTDRLIYRPYGPQDVEAALTAAGFTIVDRRDRFPDAPDAAEGQAILVARR